MNETLFVSYHHDTFEDKYKNLLVGWSKNQNDFFNWINFEDTSIGVSINSSDAGYIKRKIKEKISQSSVFLCLVGEETYKSDWVNWEIETAIELRKRIIAVKLDNSYTSPKSLYSAGASWARSFKAESIMHAYADSIFRH